MVTTAAATKFSLKVLHRPAETQPRLAAGVRGAQVLISHLLNPSARKRQPNDTTYQVSGICSVRNNRIQEAFGWRVTTKRKCRFAAETCRLMF